MNLNLVREVQELKNKLEEKSKEINNHIIENQKLQNNINDMNKEKEDYNKSNDFYINNLKKKTINKLQLYYLNRLKEKISTNKLNEVIKQLTEDMINDKNKAKKEYENKANRMNLNLIPADEMKGYFLLNK